MKHPKQPAQVRIAGAGIACLDYLFEAPPAAWGDTVRVGRWMTEGGGKTATALVTAARLGARTHLLTRLGDDEAGRHILEGLNNEGVETRGTHCVPSGESPISFVHVDNKSGDRTIFHREARLLSSGPQPDLSAVREAHVLIVDDAHIDLAVAAAEEARATGVPVLGDIMPKAKNRRLIPLVDILIAPHHYAALPAFKGDPSAAACAILQMGPRVGIVTLGPRGWTGQGPDGHATGAALEVEVVDTTGAGDVFHGAFAVGLAMGWNWIECARLATVAAGLKCRAFGGRKGIPRWHELTAFL